MKGFLNKALICLASIALLVSCSPVSGAILVGSSLGVQQATPTPGFLTYLPIVENQKNPGSTGSGGPAGPTATLAPTATTPPTAAPTATILPTPIPTISGSTGGTILLAAGDIARCGSPGDQLTANILGQYPNATIAPLGDNAYESGTITEYTSCYGPTWGVYNNRAEPIPGNHDYLTPNASGYFQYFGSIAGDPTKGYYSYNLGGWHMIALNSNCSQVGSCGVGSPQETWLRADLAANPTQCSLAYWHDPFFSSGMNGDDTEMRHLFTDLYTAGVDILLSGHDHDYERFAPQDPSGNLDTAHGIVQFVAGTGGGDHTALVYPLQPNSQASNDTTFGILKLALKSGSYSWQFIPVQGGSFTDSGSGTCH